MDESLLSRDTDERIQLLFRPEDWEEVRRILIKDCGNNLPFCQNLDARALDRFRFAALKLSDGDFAELQQAVKLAKEDWRDLLVASGFANDVQAHRAWLPERKW